MSPPGSAGYEHVVHVKYRYGTSIGTCTRQQMAAALESGDTAFVQGPTHQSEVGIYELNGKNTSGRMRMGTGTTTSWRSRPSESLDISCPLVGQASGKTLP
jgi:hypothetical protein